MTTSAIPAVPRAPHLIVSRIGACAWLALTRDATLNTIMLRPVSRHLPPTVGWFVVEAPTSAVLDTSFCEALVEVAAEAGEAEDPGPRLLLRTPGLPAAARVRDLLSGVDTVLDGSPGDRRLLALRSLIATEAEVA